MSICFITSVLQKELKAQSTWYHCRSDWYRGWCNKGAKYHHHCHASSRYDIQPNHLLLHYKQISFARVSPCPFTRLWFWGRNWGLCSKGVSLNPFSLVKIQIFHLLTSFDRARLKKWRVAKVLTSVSSNWFKCWIYACCFYFWVCS